MNIAKVKEIINDPYHTDKVKRQLVLEVIAEDPEAITEVLFMLAEERRARKELVNEMNGLVGMAEVMVNNPAAELNTDVQLSAQITVMYEKYKNIISPAFKRPNEQKAD